MDRILLIFLALEVPVFFCFAASTQLLRHRRPEDWLPKLLGLAFPTLFLGGVGLPLWAAWRVLGAP